ncbi:MAG TPA: HAD hydrolase family protein [Chitinophagaceae bacterium]|nr:HAD hydrolase family protein [Chitinophagaceae bacterium]
MNVLKLFKPIRAFVLDMDGVLTDGNLLILSGGEWVRCMNIKDGYSLQLAVKKGYHVFIISGSVSVPVAERLSKLGVKEVHQGIQNKKEKLEELMKRYSLTSAEVLYMGDDIPDYEAMQSVALPVCPADAVSEIKQIALYISPLKGGEGCVRDVLEKTLKLNNDWGIDTAVPSQ